MTPTSPAQLTCDTAASHLTIIDIQERLGEAMPNKVLNRVVKNSSLLLRAADLLGVPVLVSEQYPEGLGPTHADILSVLPSGATTFSKTSFSCCGANDFNQAMSATSRNQVIIVGMEAHVCVLQTALQLLAQGKQVFVVEDAVCSRRLENYQNALDRLRQSGVWVVSAESVIFEWLKDANHENFKAIQEIIR